MSGIVPEQSDDCMRALYFLKGISSNCENEVDKSAQFAYSNHRNILILRIRKMLRTERVLLERCQRETVSELGAVFTGKKGSASGSRLVMSESVDVR